MELQPHEMAAGQQVGWLPRPTPLEEHVVYGRVAVSSPDVVVLILRFKLRERDAYLAIFFDSDDPPVVVAVLVG